MSKNAKVIIIVILIIGVIVCCMTLGKNDSEENSETDIENIETNNVIENTAIENEVLNNTIENEVVEEEPIVENITEVKPQGAVYETSTDAGTTDKKQQAISLVKEKWGEDNTVTFRCDSVSTNGEYIIAVVSKESASVKNYFRVNLSTKSVEVDY